MRKYRSWLMGLGIGLILGASMLQLITMSQKQLAMDAVPPVITREQLDEEAKKSGLVLVPEDSKLYTQKQLDAKVLEAISANHENLDSDNDNSLDNDETLMQPGQEDKLDDVTNTGDSITIDLYVRYGMTLTEVAEELLKLRVIDDKDEFIKEAWSISKTMNVGTASFVGKPSYQEIMIELTR